MLVMFLAFTLVLAYHSRLDPETLSQILGIRYVTLGYLMECWLALVVAHGGGTILAERLTLKPPDETVAGEAAQLQPRDQYASIQAVASVIRSHRPSATCSIRD
jgi:hypothetical protein